MSKQYLDKSGLSYLWSKLKGYFQQKLVSGTNIKTINNQSLLGSGNISISGGGTSNFVFEQNIQLDGGSNSLSANNSWTEPYTGSSKIITVPAGKYIVTASARYSNLTSGNQYGVAISYKYTDDSTWYASVKGRQLIRVSGTVSHSFTGVALVNVSKETSFTVGTYHQAACKLTDSIIGVFGFAN